MVEPSYWTRAIGIAAWVCLVVSPATAATQLVLADGQVLTGRSVERDGDLYLLRLESGQILPLPAALVREVRELQLPGESPDANRSAPTEPSPETDPEPAIDESDPDPPTEASLDQDSRRYSGGDRGPEFARLYAQVPDDGRGTSRFTRGVAEPDWAPEHYRPRQGFLDAFEPSRWFDSPAEPDWEPEHYRPEQGYLDAFEPSRWGRSPVNANWKPNDGFGRDD